MANSFVINKELKRKNNKPIENLCKNKFEADEIWEAANIYPGVRYLKGS